MSPVKVGTGGQQEQAKQSAHLHVHVPGMAGDGMLTPGFVFSADLPGCALWA